MKNKIKDFINDETMANAVYDVLWRFFTKKRDTKDVQMLAAERMSALMLEDAWKELQKYKIDEKNKTENGVNIGL